jgi:hypothetical protein
MNITPERVTQLRAEAGFDQLLAMVTTLAAAVVASDLYLNSYDTSPPSRIKAETRLAVEEAMALIRPQRN